MEGLRKNIYLSLLVTIALGLSIVESFIPNLLIPGAKLGLSNIVLLTTLVIYGFKEALVVTILKSLLLVLGTGNVIALFYSLPSGIMSCIIMNLGYKKLVTKREVLSLMGVSILGAATHNWTQVTIGAMILQNIKIYSYLPFLIIVSLFTGYFVGLSSTYISEKLNINLQRGGIR